MLKSSVLNAMYESRLENELARRLARDKDYQLAEKKARKKEKKIKKVKLSKEQWMVVDEALAASDGSSIEYGRVAYQQGFQDAIYLMYEL